MPRQTTGQRRRQARRPRPRLARSARNAAWFWSRGKSTAVGRPCHMHADCGDPKRYCCHRAERRCVDRAAPGSVNDCHLWTPIARPADPYPSEWPHQPGEPGFNAYVRGLLSAAALPRSLSCERADGDRWYQRVLAFLVHPRTPIQRLLVAWQLGTGKTIGMLRVLDNFFDDTRPKVLLFPTEAVANNFYEELATQPGRYRDYLRASPEVPPWPEGPRDNRGALIRDLDADQLVQLAGEREHYVRTIRAILERWPITIGRNASSGLAAPLRCFTYAQAGTVGGGNDTLVGNAVVRWPMRGHPGYVDRGGGAPLLPDCLTSMVVLCDEAHNLLTLPAGAEALQRCRERLFRARNSVVLFFTATPVVNGAAAVAQADDMLRLVKGEQGTKGNDEGYISWYMDRPESIFAAIEPPTVHLHDQDPVPADRSSAPPPLPASVRMPNVHAVRIDGPESAALWSAYVRARFTAAVAAAPPRHRAFGLAPGPVPRGCLDPAAGDPACAPSLAALEHLLHSGAAERRELAAERVTLAAARETAPKLVAIARSVYDVPLKTLILIHEVHGAATLVRLLDELGLKPLHLGRPPEPTRKMTKAQRLAAMAQGRVDLRAFNAAGNRDGSRHRVIVAVAEEYSEGVSFMHVRRVILADLSPGLERPSWSLVKQRIGRALRSCSHAALPAHLRTLRVDLYLAVHHHVFRRPPTLDLEKYLALQREIPQVEAAMDRLRALSIDAPYYDSAPPAPSAVERKLERVRSGAVFARGRGWRERLTAAAGAVRRALGRGDDAARRKKEWEEELRRLVAEVEAQ